MAKIGLVSFEYKNSCNVFDNEARWPLFKQIQKIAETNKISYLFFSGSTLCDRKRRNFALVRRNVRRFAKLFEDFSIIFEVSYNFELGNQKSPYGLYAFEKGIQKMGPIIQLFSSSKDPKYKYEELWDQIQSNKRLVRLNNKKILVLICGEINILHNSQKNNNRVDGLRYGFKGGSIRSVKYDIMFNPTHQPLTTLFGKYKNRLKYMSERKFDRLALLNYNVHKDQTQRTGAFIAYKNGCEIQRVKGEKECWFNGWAMRVIDF